MAQQLQDTYFRRFFVPIVLSILVLAIVAVILSTTPGTPYSNTLANVMRGGSGSMMALFRK
jgi:hypothetical protein